MEKKILACLGTNPISGDVLQFADSLAVRNQGELTIVHAREREPYVYENEEMFESFLSEQKIRAPYHIVDPFGRAQEVIVQETRKNKYDLVVIGGHSHGVVGRLFMGNVTRYVLHHADCPVYVLKRPEETLNKTILVPIDFTAINKKTVAIADEWASTTGHQLNFLHVDRIPHYWNDWMEAYGPAVEKTTHDPEALTQKLKEFLEEMKVSVDYATAVRHGDPGTEIAAHQKEIKADLMVLAAHSHTVMDRLLLGGTTDYLLNHATCPLYVYREKRKGK